MQEVTLRVRFTQVCPGNSKRVRKSDQQTIFDMRRDPRTGRVMFMPTWWRSIITYAAQVTSKHQQLVKKIDWSPYVDGTPHDWRRYFPLDPDKPSARKRFALHAAFSAGQVVGIKCVLPTGISVDDFAHLMEVAGEYKGISPYKFGEGFGTFEVVEVNRAKSSAKETAKVKQ